MTLLETYAKKIAVADAVYKKAHMNESMDENRKMCLAAVLNNTTKFINEKFDNSVGTQRSALGDYKKFCLNL